MSHVGYLFRHKLLVPNLNQSAHRECSNFRIGPFVGDSIDKGCSYRCQIEFNPRGSMIDMQF